MKKIPLREGEDIMEPTHIPTASAHESQSQEVQHVAEIDRQIADLKEKRRLATQAAYPTFEDFARLPWSCSGAGVIRSASNACVVIIADSDFQSDDFDKKTSARSSLAQRVMAGVNNHGDLLAALKECREACGAAKRVIARRHDEVFFDKWSEELKDCGIANGFCERADAVIAKAEGR